MCNIMNLIHNSAMDNVLSNMLGYLHTFTGGRSAGVEGVEVGHGKDRARKSGKKEASGDLDHSRRHDGLSGMLV
jgi:hypothetical protein